MQRYDKIDRPTINIGKKLYNNCQIKDKRIDFWEKQAFSSNVRQNPIKRNIANIM